MTSRLCGRMCPDSERIKHFRMNAAAAKYAGFDREMRFIEVRYDYDSDPSAGDQRPVDEIVMPGVHLEGMDEDAVWMDVGGLSVWFRAVRVKGQRKLRLVVTCYPSDCTPYVVTAEEATGCAS